MLWMLDNQGGRRNLADIDRISIARKKEVILAEQAKENQRQSDGRGIKGPPISANLIEPIHTRKEAAKSAGEGKPKSANPSILIGQDSVLSVSTEQNKTGPRLSTGAGPMADNTTQNKDETEPSEPTI